jgi:hypothetical protein
LRFRLMGLSFAEPSLADQSCKQFSCHWPCLREPKTVTTNSRPTYGF